MNMQVTVKETVMDITNGRTLHHTISQLLPQQDEQQAFLQLESTLRLILKEDQISEEVALRCLFCLGIFVAFQENGQLSTSRSHFESMLRKVANLTRPYRVPAKVSVLHPDLHDGKDFYF